MPSIYDTNPWAGFLEENPESMFRAFLGNTGTQGSNFTNYFKSKYSDIYGDYWGKLGNMALQGTAPSLNFYDYMQKYNFNDTWKSLSPGYRGLSGSPRVNWNV